MWCEQICWPTKWHNLMTWVTSLPARLPVWGSFRFDVDNFRDKAVFSAYADILWNSVIQFSCRARWYKLRSVRQRDQIWQISEAVGSDLQLRHNLWLSLRWFPWQLWSRVIWFDWREWRYFRYNFRFEVHLIDVRDLLDVDGSSSGDLNTGFSTGNLVQIWDGPKFAFLNRQVNTSLCGVAHI